MKGLAMLGVLVLSAIMLGGCTGGADGGVTKEQEEAFRNPPKEIPPESLKAMQESRERGMKAAEEARKRSSSPGQGQ